MTRALSSLLVLAIAAGLAGCGIGDSQAQLRSAIDAKNQELDQCYAGALARDRDAAGSLSAYVHVDHAEGRVNQVEFTGGDGRDPSLESCISDSLTRVQLTEPPAANLKVAYTFQLTPEG